MGAKIEIYTHLDLFLICADQIHAFPEDAKTVTYWNILKYVGMKTKTFLKMSIRLYQIPSCACRFSPSYPPAVHRTDTRRTRDEPANPTNHCEEFTYENLTERLTFEAHFISLWRSSKRSYSSSSSNKSLSSSDCTSSQVFPNSCNTSTEISTKPHC